MEQRKAQKRSKAAEESKPLRRGWCWGPKSFREELLEMIGEKQGPQHHGEELRESDEQKAERLVAEMLKQVAWSESTLKDRRKTDARKVRMAEHLRRETTMSWWWVAKRLPMGHWRTASNAVRAARQGEGEHSNSQL